MKQNLLFIGLFLMLISCKDANKLVLSSSTGRINSILIVTKNSNWSGDIGKTIRDIVKEPVEGLPQPEVQFRVTQIKPNSFNSIFENNRNILVVGIDKRKLYRVIKNKYASPQIIMTITGKNQTDLIDQIKKHSGDIISVFKKGDLQLYQSKLSKSVWKQNSFKQLNNVSLSIPKKYYKVEDLDSFLWLRKYLPKDGTINLLAYSMPLPKENDITMATILEQRDSIGKQYVPGQFDNSYMQTSIALPTLFKQYKINGITTYETRGLWDVKNDFMGGAFINYSFIDRKNNRILCLDGFVYAPSQNKRDYIFELEAIFKTLKF